MRLGCVYIGFLNAFSFFKTPSNPNGLLDFLKTENDVPQTLLYKAQSLVSRAHFMKIDAVGLLFYNVFGTRFPFPKMFSYTMDYLTF